MHEEDGPDDGLVIDPLLLSAWEGMRLRDVELLGLAAELSEEPEPLRRWAAIIGGRYMGEDQAEVYGARNGVPGELLVIVTPTRVVGTLDLAG